MFNQMKVATRLSVAFGTVLILLLALVAMGISRLAAINDGLRVITEENNVEMTHALGMRGAAFEMSISIRNMILQTDVAKVKQEQTTLDQSFQKFDDEYAVLNQMFTSISSTTQTEKDLMVEIKSSWTTVKQGTQTVASMALGGKQKDAYSYFMS